MGMTVDRWKYIALMRNRGGIWGHLFRWAFEVLDKEKHISKWDTRNTTTGSSNSDQIRLPIDAGVGSQDLTINWGDGTVEHITDGANAIHTYNPEGEYTIEIIGTVNNFQFIDSGDKNKLLEIQQWGKNFGFNSANGLNGCVNLNITATDFPTGIFYKPTSLFRLFRTCNNLTTVPNINLWDVSDVTEMRAMAFNSSFDLDISSWDVSNVENMDSVFRSCSFNQDISSWDTSGAGIMSFMFYLNDDFDQDISWNSERNTWNVANVSTFATFEGCINTTNYDKFLIGLKAQDDAGYILQEEVSLDMTNIQYGADPNAVAAHDWLTKLVVNDGKGWSISDGGQV